MNKLMRRLTVALSFAAVTMALPNRAEAGAVLDTVLATKKLRVAVGTDWGAMSFLNDKHELDGYDIAVAKAVAKSLGVEIEFVTPSWEVITSGQWQNRWDMAMGQMTPTKARTEKFDFPAVYAYDPVIAVVHKDSKANKPSDLDGKVIGVTAGTVAESYAEHKLTPDWIGAEPITYQFTPSEVKRYDSTNIVLDDLRIGDGARLSGAIADEVIAAKAIKDGYPLRQLGEPLFASPGAIAVLHGDKEFSDKIAAAVKSMSDDGTLSKLSIKWFGANHFAQN
ncbi:transporter substrate-binding domain-containing protein [Sinorhizobium saheli]|uniref:Amino acid ABC transporter substrate-binding protein n=1 Tax=Sinorhizobium saheli TaxID=36856 RepID=A0A178YSB5_SINSA|nr:transporter substrate-binding domain-containing protein [Sinorhizobium saheli]MQW90023.1 transporter substrate-binding domain-containing protein [Sinorhizobium saheli]OAP50409.1 amino acid ABC transporter substrate-binding protein [Sinorhizobium saheli]